MRLSQIDRWFHLTGFWLKSLHGGESETFNLSWAWDVEAEGAQKKLNATLSCNWLLFILV